MMTIGRFALLLKRRMIRSRSDVFDLNTETWQPGPTLNCDYCVPLARDSFGRLWAGGDLGVWIFDADGHAVAHLNAESGLPADSVYGVAFAPTGEAWLATPGGVAVYDDSTVTGGVHALF